MRTTTVFRRWLARALIPVLLIQSAAAQLPDLGDPAQASLTPAQERRIAEEVLREVRFQEPTYLDDPEVEEYLAEVGQRLTSSGATQNSNYQFFVLKDSTINAFAMPGGVIGIHTGLITTTETESELASVMAHEVGHVEQHHMARMLSRQGKTTALVLASLLVAVLAGHSNANAAGAVLASGQAAAIQNQLGYSRDYEREADRVGLQILAAAGFNPQAMPDFFQRMFQQTRMLENNAPTYLRTHPLTQDRISDIEGRVRQIGPRAVVSAIDYVFVRAKIEALQLGGTSAIARIGARPHQARQEQAYRWYGLARAYLAERNFAEADKALTQLQALKLESAMIPTLAADLAVAEGRPADAARICHAAAPLYPTRKSLVYCEAEAWLAAGDAVHALAAVDPHLRAISQDYRLYVLQAKANTALGRDAQAHRAQAEVYVLQGDLAGAVDQLQLAQRDGGGNFMEQASIDARLRELRQRVRDEMDAKKDKDDRNGR